MTASLILASKSPVRRRLLEGAGLSFRCVPADLDETPEKSEAPSQLALRLAKQKALSVSAAHPGAIVIGADQTGRLASGRPLNKCYNDEDAQAQLKAMAGRPHTFWSAAALVEDGKVKARVSEVATVHFRDLSSAEIAAYVATGEYTGSCGSYRLEERGANLIERVEGGVHAVVGLPFFSLLSALRKLGVAPLAARAANNGAPAGQAQRQDSANG